MKTKPPVYDPTQPVELSAINNVRMAHRFVSLLPCECVAEDVPPNVCYRCLAIVRLQRALNQLGDA